ncbi:MAG: four-carbon acid sugar kinase family protein [Tepidanaerobacteraceae bacterium]
MGYISIIADDLTGASDTGIQFRKYGLKTKVIVDVDKLSDFFRSDEILSINANTRPLKPEKAYKKVYDICHMLKQAGFSCIYKKVDSTFRGNPGIELEAVMDALGSNLAILVPSFPDNGRCMVNGYLKLTSVFAKNNDIETISKAEQELCHVPTIMQEQMKRKVANIDSKTVRQGNKAIYGKVLELHEKGFQVIAIDAVTKEDLNNIALACKFLPKETVLAGAAGFAAFLPEVMGLSSKTHVKPLLKEGILLVVTGTCNSTTRVQIDEVLNKTTAHLIKIDTDKIINGMTREEVLKVVQSVTQLYKTEETISHLFIIAVDTLFKLPKVNNDLISKWGKTIASAVGEIVGILVDKKIVQSLVVTGGDTALHVLKALQAKGIDLEEELLAGIPSGRLFGGKAHDIPIVTKAGGFGPPMALLEVIERLQNSMEA